MTLPNSLCILQLALAWLLTTDLAWLVAAVALELVAFLFLGFAVGFIISLSCVCCMFVLRAVNALVGPTFFLGAAWLSMQFCFMVVLPAWLAR